MIKAGEYQAHPCCLPGGADIIAGKGRSQCVHTPDFKESADSLVESRGQEGNTLLHQAIDIGGEDIIQLAVQGGGSLLERNDQGETAYQVAQRRRSQHWHGDDSSIDEKFFAAVCLGDDVGVKTRLCHSVSVEDKDYDGDTGLHVACWVGQEDIADLLIQLGADVNMRNNDHRTPLYCAYQSSSPSLVSLLVKSGSEVSCVHKTVVQGDVDTLRTLIQQGADVNQQDPSMKCSLLHVACLMGHSDLVTCLFQQGVHVNAVDGGSCTPLHQACVHGHTQIVQYLISNGTDVNVTDGKK